MRLIYPFKKRVKERKSKSENDVDSRWQKSNEKELVLCLRKILFILKFVNNFTTIFRILQSMKIQRTTTRSTNRKEISFHFSICHVTFDISPNNKSNIGYGTLKDSVHLKLVRHLNLSIQEVAATNHLHCRNPLLPFVVKLFQPSQSRQGFHHLTKT